MAKHGSSPEGVIVGCCNLVVEDGAYLLVKESKPSALFRYNLPAGKPEVGETLLEAAAREALEEAGIEVSVVGLVGIYHCAQTTEGFGVVNFVFESLRVGGALRSSAAHPEVRFFSAEEVDDLAERRMLRGTHIRGAIHDHAHGRGLPLSVLQTVPPSAAPPIWSTPT